MRTFVLVLCTVLLFSAPAFAQTECVATTNPADYIANQTRLTFVSPSHTAKTPAGTEVVKDYLGEVRQVGQTAVITNFTIPKTSVAPVTSGPANCYQALMPGMTGLLPTSQYTVTVVTRGPGGNVVAAAASNPFSLVGAPQGVVNTVVVP